MRYSLVYEQGDTSWGAYVSDLPGCVAVGDNRAEVEVLIVEAIGPTSTTFARLDS